MPELPEVETAMQGIRPHLLNKKIREVTILEPRLMDVDDAKDLENQTVKDVTRRGKWILVKLDKDCDLLMHLRLTGSLLWHQDTNYLPHERGRMTFEDGYLSLVDPRGFGTWQYMPREQMQAKLDGSLSLEPIDPAYTGKYLRTRLKKTTRAIKTAILDQNVAAGMGNIYVDEALWHTRIHPLTAANKLTPAQDNKLAKAMQKGLLAGIEHGGSSVRNYYRADGTAGSHQDHLEVYGRRNKPCRRCGTLIERITVGGRGTHFCPHCQIEEK